MSNFARSDWSSLSTLSTARTRSISPENLTGEAGGGGRAVDGMGARHALHLGQKWKISPSIAIAAGETLTLADIQGEGVIQQIWMTLTNDARHEILRFYWDDAETPAIEAPAGDFFCNGLASSALVSSLPVCVNPKNGFNCYWEMPFRRRARITLTNQNETPMVIYYQVNYALGEVPADAGYLHAQFRRTNRVPFKGEHTILDGIDGQGQYVGVYMVWGALQNGWWGEGEIKFFLDDDEEFPTICGTGTEDYFCGSYGFKGPDGEYQLFSTPYAGMPQIVKPAGPWDVHTYIGLYRWHITDPVRFQRRLRVTIQDLGWDGYNYDQYLPLQDDISSTAFFYLDRPAHAPVPFPEGADLDHYVNK